GPQLLLPMLEGLATAGKPLSAMPNAGFPKRVGDRVVYPRSSPEYFALFAREAAGLGARIIGGCCGTSPEHIRAIAEAVKKLRPDELKVRSAGVRAGAATSAAKADVRTAREPESRLWKKIQAGQFIVSVEVDPPKGVALERL